MRTYINSLKKKPEHVRRRIALLSTSGITGFVAIIWAVTLSSTGVFSLAPAAESPKVTTTPSTNSFSQLLGAVGATSANSGEPALSIVDNGSSSTLDTKKQKATSATVIPF